MVLIVPNANSNVQGGKARPGLRIGGVVAACLGAAGLVACRPDKYVNDIRRASRSKSDTKRYDYAYMTLEDGALSPICLIWTSMSLQAISPTIE